MAYRHSVEKGNGFLKDMAYLQIIGIILVVVGHSFHDYPDGCGGKSLLIYGMMYSFRMPLFMFVSGFLMIYTTLQRGNPPSWRKFTLGKVKRLMVPFVVLSLVTFVPRSLLSFYADDPVELSLSSLADSLLYQDSLVIPYFWFLQSSFTLLVGLYLVFILFGSDGKNDKVLYVSLILFFLVLGVLGPGLSGLFSLDNTVKFGLYFVIGASYCRFRKYVDSIIPWTRLCFLLGSMLVWALLYFLLDDTLLMPLCSLSGIIMCVSLSKVMVSRGIRFLDHLVGANYIIFLLSWYFNVLTQQILHGFVELPWFVYTAMSLVSGIYVPWLFYRFMRTHPDNCITNLSKLLLGQSFKVHSHN